MKKLFTLVALLAVFLGAKAVSWDEVKKIDYKGLTDFPYYIMGYAPDIVNGIMVDDPVPYRKLWRDGDDGFTDEVKAECTEVKINGGTFYLQMLESNPWRQYFAADGVTTDIGTNYKIVARVKVSQDCTVRVNMGNWTSALSADVNFPASDDFQDVEWEYNEIPVASCFIIAQPGVTDAVIEWESITVYKQHKEGGRPEVWLQDIENGNAETPWTAEQAAIRFDDQTQNFTISAWSKEKGRNMNTNNGWDPFVSDIEVDPKDPSNHVFVCHGQPATTEGDAAAWDNQFWIQSQHSWTSGTKLKIKFRSMCDYAEPVKTNTQIHKQNPSDYLIWHAIGDITFTNEWNTFDDVMNIQDDMAGGWSIAFNLNANVKDAVNFYFDDLSWEYLQLDEGYFVSGVNVDVNPQYNDLDMAIQFEEGVDFNGDPCLVATFGTKGDANTYVDQLMISTKRGDDAAYKGATLKPEENPKTVTPDNWIDYTLSANAKIDLPGLGVWRVYLDTEYESMAFEMLEGTPYEQPDPVAVVTNATEVTVKGQTREYTEAEAEAAGIDKPENPGQPWDNQFFLVANSTVKAGTVTHVKFSYKRSNYQGTADVTSGTQSHNEPGQYIHWAAIGSFTFTDEWQEYDADFTIPNECDGSDNASGYKNDFKSIAFNMAEVKEACDYELKDIQWYVVDSSLGEGLTYKNLIDETGSANLYVKEGAGTNPHPFGTDPSGITNITAKQNSSAAIYNIAGQKVDNNFKGIVVKDGKKFVNK
jgi:hypothetical protein